MRVLGGDAVGELVQVRLPGDGIAGGLERRDRGRGLLGNVVAEDQRPVGRRQPCGVEEVLDAEREAFADLVGDGEERPQIVACRTRTRRCRSRR
jgi:hypothetical protein